MNDKKKTGEEEVKRDVSDREQVHHNKQNIKARQEVMTGDLEKFNSVDKWWGNNNAE